MEIKLDFTDDEMKDYLLRTGKYKITSVKCMASDGWLFSISESSVEVAYPIGDNETEDWLMNIGVPPIYEFDDLRISTVFTKEIKTKLLN